MFKHLKWLFIISYIQGIKNLMEMQVRSASQSEINILSLDICPTISVNVSLNVSHTFPTKVLAEWQDVNPSNSILDVWSQSNDIYFPLIHL